MSRKRFAWLPLLLLAAFALPATAQAMHISEGILPTQWVVLWYAVAIPFVAWGLRDLRIKSAKEPFFKPMVGLIGAAVFVISCMPIPVPSAGTCSHPCGTGMAAIFIGPALTIVVSSIALLLQALFLSHGGLTTLGANIVSMGVVGALVGWSVFWLARRLGLPAWGAAFLAGMLSDWATYAATSFELASALHGTGSMLNLFAAIGVSFLPTQLPLGIFEGVVAAGVYTFIAARRPSLLHCLGVEPLPSGCSCK
jgi:cobalt/nickel transport system permease protein